MKTKNPLIKTLITIIIILTLTTITYAEGIGGTISTDGDYTVHTFTSNSSFYWNEGEKNISLLIIAGGGSGGTPYGGGGGAGGLKYYNENLTINNYNYSIKIGRGGLNVASSHSNGTNSSFGNISTKGGGGGGDNNLFSNGRSGGSGGGGIFGYIGGTGTTGEGKNGGNGGGASPYYAAGGGGGAGGTGDAGLGAEGGNGGTGFNTSINGTLTCYAGGGGGSVRSTGTPGSGKCGGGNSRLGSSEYGTNATFYGSGGGGAGGTGNAGAGFQGIIIIRYRTISTATTIDFNNPTPTNGEIYYNQTTNSINVNISTTNAYTNSNTTIYLYNSTGLKEQITNTTNANFTYLFNNLPSGIYYINSTNNNATNNTNSETRTFYIYSQMQKGINNPLPGSEQATQYLNITWNATTINPTESGVTINQYNITLHNSTATIKTLNTTSTLNYYWDIYSENLSTGEYTINIESTDTKNNKTNQNVSFNITTNALINITAYSFTGAQIQNFTINITDLNTNITNSETTNNYTAIINIKKNNAYTLTLDAEEYSYSYLNITSTNETYQNINLTAYTTNSVNIRIYDETTNILITENITITFTQGLIEITNSTTTGTYYQDQLTDGSWNIKFSGGNYTLKTYTITVYNRSNQNLDAYLSSSSQNSIFTIMDFDSSSLIEGASFTQSKLINGSWTIINSKYSDITGRIQFDYIPNNKYQFLITATGYTNNLFYLDPVLFSSYNIRMTKTVTLTPDITPDFLGVHISYYNNLTKDTTWLNQQENTIIWTITSPIGSLEIYNLTITNPPEIIINQNGSLAIGQEFIQNFTINTTNNTARLIIEYCYKSTTSSIKCFKDSYSIIGIYFDTSMIANKDKTYGLGVFERVLIITIAVLFVAGIIFMYAGAIPGLIVVTLIYGFSLSTGFVTIWMIFPSLMIGFIMIATKKGD